MFSSKSASHPVKASYNLSTLTSQHKLCSVIGVSSLTHVDTMLQNYLSSISVIPSCLFKSSKAQLKNFLPHEIPSLLSEFMRHLQSESHNFPFDYTSDTILSSHLSFVPQQNCILLEVKDQNFYFVICPCQTWHRHEHMAEENK